MKKSKYGMSVLLSSLAVGLFGIETVFAETIPSPIVDDTSSRITALEEQVKALTAQTAGDSLALIAVALSAFCLLLVIALIVFFVRHERAHLKEQQEQEQERANAQREREKARIKEQEEAQKAWIKEEREQRREAAPAFLDQNVSTGFNAAHLSQAPLYNEENTFEKPHRMELFEDLYTAPTVSTKVTREDPAIHYQSLLDLFNAAYRHGGNALDNVPAIRISLNACTDRALDFNPNQLLTLKKTDVNGYFIALDEQYLLLNNRIFKGADFAVSAALQNAHIDRAFDFENPHGAPFLNAKIEKIERMAKLHSNGDGTYRVTEKGLIILS